MKSKVEDRQGVSDNSLSLLEKPSLFLSFSFIPIFHILPHSSVSVGKLLANERTRCGKTKGEEMMESLVDFLQK